MPIDRQNERRHITQALRKGAASAPQLAQLAGLSPRSVLRVLKEWESELVSAGKAGRRRYALRQPIRQNNVPQALYSVDAQAQVQHVCSFNLIQPSGSHAEMSSYCPMSQSARDGWWEGLPYAIYAMQPRGFLGRSFARLEEPHLGVLGNPRSWSDETIAHVLAQRCPDTSGNLILGDASLRIYQASLIAPPQTVGSKLLAQHYSACAQTTLELGLAGSSAAGEFPKFTALRDLPCSAAKSSQTPHVIVKFSGTDTPRWSDLLRLECLALQIARELLGVLTADARIIEAKGRVFLESERFDRFGLHGRSSLVSLQSVSDHFLGHPSQDWPDHAKALNQLGLLSNADSDNVLLLWWFGQLIGNTDMHFGNLSLRIHRDRFELAPLYDMLPMTYAPLATGELPLSKWEPRLPTPQQAPAWRKACAAALAFWTQGARVVTSPEMLVICQSNTQKLKRLQDLQGA